MTPNEMKPFWMVYGIGCREPRYQHPTEAGAITEAERLARVSPGTTFVVLEAVTAIRKRDLEHFDLRTAPSPPGTRVPLRDDDGDEIPF